MKKQINYHGIFAYFKNAVRQKIKTKKYSLVTATLFIVIFSTSYFWTPHSTSADNLSFDLEKHQEYHCSLQRIIDGDTIIADCPITNPQRVNIRIWGMDAPETGQIPWGEKATIALNSIFLSNKHDIITIKIRDIDQYNRYVGQIFINNKEIDVGLKMVSEGFAVVYKQYNNDPQYQAHEEFAKIALKGIWQYPGAQQNPAAWRKVNPF